MPCAVKRVHKLLIMNRFVVEMRMVRWMCGMKLQDRIPSKGLRERLGLDDIISVLQQNRLVWAYVAKRRQ